MRSPWWARNRGWMIALVPLLVCATLACSQRLVNLYLPWEENGRRISGQDRRGELHQEFVVTDTKNETSTTSEITVAVQVTDVQVVENENGKITAAEGAQLWQVDLEFTAEPDQILMYCSVQLEADGVRYGVMEAKVHNSPYGTMAPLSCVPEETPGPSLSLFTLEVTETTPPRPRTWPRRLTFALPTGVTPQALRLWWHHPEYLYIPL